MCRGAVRRWALRWNPAPPQHGLGVSTAKNRDSDSGEGRPPPRALTVPDAAQDRAARGWPRGSGRRLTGPVGAGAGSRRAGNSPAATSSKKPRRRRSGSRSPQPRVARPSSPCGAGSLCARAPRPDGGGRSPEATLERVRLRGGPAPPGGRRSLALRLGPRALRPPARPASTRPRPRPQAIPGSVLTAALGQGSAPTGWKPRLGEVSSLVPRELTAWADAGGRGPYRGAVGGHCSESWSPDCWGGEGLNTSVPPVRVNLFNCFPARFPPCKMRLHVLVPWIEAGNSHERLLCAGRRARRTVSSDAASGEHRADETHG